ncbi:MAG: ABC-type antimicrobial peptide transport system, permease component [Bacilli bacterium]|nr:ABC-type antimicrobial peptide transport system, permease component [Bacilli bacterium]
MNIFESFRISFRSLLANKLRSFLTMLGIIIGVGAVIIMVSIGEGTNQVVTQQIQSLGSNLITISPGAVSSGGVSQGSGSAQTLKMADVDSINQLDAVAAAAPSYQGRYQVAVAGKNTNTTVTGTSANFTQVKSWPMLSGRFITDDDVTNGTKVAVLGTTTVGNLFGNSNYDPVGQMVKINNVPFTVVGVLSSKGASGFQDQDDAVYIPINTYRSRFLGGKSRDSIQQILVEAKSADQINQAINEMEFTLRQNHKLGFTKPDDFSIRNFADILASAQASTQTMTLFLGGVAAISLLVGGIGIMNIMLVSVTERTREIGIRKAIGAKERDLLFQFLIEAVTLAVLGGAVGVAIGYIGSGNIGNLMHTPTSVPLNAVVLSVVFSAAIGIIFGVVPARKASKLDPIEALRYE